MRAAAFRQVRIGFLGVSAPWSNGASFFALAYNGPMIFDGDPPRWLVVAVVVIALGCAIVTAGCILGLDIVEP
jgi:hypothetical protein